MEEIKELTESFRKEVNSLERLFNKLNETLDVQSQALQKILRGLYGEEENNQVGLIQRVSNIEEKTKKYDRLINIGVGVIIALQVVSFLISIYINK